ncbi:MAG: FecR family protein, partial [Gammaproteobacteria bacterium]
MFKPLPLMFFSSRKFVTVLILALTCGAANGQSATVAGKVVFATGNPVATNAAGTQRSLGRGDDVLAGDNLRTPSNSRLQVSFIDGAYISLQPDSEYKIEEYEYAGQPDGSESAVYRLIKGGVRAVTGLIGKENPEAYKVETAVATIGIRGTGHNTRLCQGDCGDKDDGLYHNTWEGITYVRNDVAETNVPAGKGVYVRDMNSPIQFLSQPSSVTAVDTAGEREEEQREEEEQTTVVSSGNQRTPEGTQTVLTDDETVTVPGSSTVLLNNGLIGVLPREDPEDGEPIDVVAGTDTSVFIDDNDSIIGLLTLEEFEGDETRVTATIDPDAMLGGDDADSVDEFNDLLATADETLLEQFRQSPANAAESFVNADGLGWGRWSGGNFLVVDALGETELIELVDHQSLHFIFGPEPPEIPTQGGAIYDFIGGTQSTSASGATIGEGVTEGFLFADFGASAGGIEMTVSHDSNDYHVAGFLAMDTEENSIFDQDSVFATTGLDGSDCNPSCPTFIEGGFAGPDNGDGTPTHVGIEYDIQEEDIIMGVAGFGLAGGDATQVKDDQILTGIFPIEGEVEGETVLAPALVSGFDSSGFMTTGG